MKLYKTTIDRYNLTEEEIKLSMSYYSPLQIKANNFFLKAGETCQYLGFVKSGLLRSYFYDDNANEITTGFYPEDNLVIAFDSFNNQVPAKEYIKAIEDSDLMVITYKRRIELHQRVPAWNQICKDLGDTKIREILDRTDSFQTLTAAERYQKFCDQFPNLLQRVNLGYIASFIGVDIATLSRIRGKR